MERAIFQLLGGSLEEGLDILKLKQTKPWCPRLEATRAGSGRRRRRTSFFEMVRFLLLLSSCVRRPGRTTTSQATPRLPGEFTKLAWQQLFEI